MNFNIRVAVAAFAATVFVVPAVAFGQASKTNPASAGNDPGEMWEITTRMEIAGMPMAMPAHTNKICLGKQASDDQFVPKNEDCKVTESRRSGNTQRYKMVCTGKNPMTGEGEITHTRDAYNGRMRLTGKMEGESMDMTQTFSGKKLGDCTGTIQNQVAKARSDADASLAEVCRGGVQKLMSDLFFGPGAACASQKAEFCSEVSKVAIAAREPAGHTALRARTHDPAGAFKACNQDFVAVNRAACAKAAETKNLEFIASGSCDDDVRRIGESGCRGRSFTSIEPSMRGVCSRYATITRGQGTTAAAATPQPAAAAKAPDSMQQGLDAVRKLLPF
jgi:Protein of unknown function (DUF3617)